MTFHPLSILWDSMYLAILRTHGLRGHVHPVFTAALLTVPGTWKPPTRPPTDEWIKKMWDIYTGQYFSAVKKNEIMPYVATWMDLEIVILNDISQIEKQKQLLRSFILRIKKVVIQVLLLTNQKETHRVRE